MSGESPQVVRVWDLPTRLFHWLLAACVAGLFITGKIGGAAMPWHSRLGYVVASLLLFRLGWGLVGGHWSRFASFCHSPRTLAAYLKQGRDGIGHAVGHNPLGGLSVLAMLAFLLAQVGTGLFSDDRADFSGPLSVFVSTATVRTVTAYHKHVGQVVIMVLVAAHLAAIAYYHFRQRVDLVTPMLRGDKHLAFPAQASRDDAPSRWLALALFLLCAAVVAWLVSLDPG